MIREPSGQILRQPRQRKWLIIAGIVFVILLFGGSLIRFYMDLLWFHSVNFEAAFWRIIYTRVGLGVAGGLAAALIIFANLEVARMRAPRFQFVTPAGDVAERYRSLFQPYARWANLGIAALVGLLTGLSTSAAWQTVLLWQNAQPFGVNDSLFNRDISFFVFTVPFYRFLIGWLFGVTIVAGLLAGVAHLLNGSIEPEPNRINIRPVVKVHLSILLAVIALLKAWAYTLDQYELVYSARGTVTGASYTDVNAQLPAFQLLSVIAVVGAVILLLNIRFRGWLIPGIAVGLWALTSVIVGAVYPAIVQRFQVEPAESQMEAPYIARNIAATRQSFALDRVDQRLFPAEERLTDQIIADNRGTIDNIRLWEPEVLIHSFRRLQAIRTYYDFHDVDIDRYTINGRPTQVMIAAREVDPSGLAPGAQNWVNTRLTYTHGYGIVAIAANSATPEGIPDFLVRELPPEGQEELLAEQMGVYYGEGLEGYVIANTDQLEIDFPLEERNEMTHYDGIGGVELSHIGRRAAFATGLADFNMMISRFITNESRVLFRRDIRERAETVAPFLRYDRDPYIVSTDDRLYWIQDAYTVSDRYPYAEEVNLAGLFPGSHFGRVNYMRNSVKVVVDAFDGTMWLYVTEPDDAIVATYQEIFPEMFTPGEQMPDSLRSHIRYPVDLFTVQMESYRTYHLTEPERVYSREDVWDFPIDTAAATDARAAFMEPYYMLMRLPEEEGEEFILMIPFTPRERPTLNGWVAARADPENFGELVGFGFPRGRSVPGPENVAARIDQDPLISQQFQLWTRAGSRVVRGNLAVIPIGDSLIYVQPVYLQAERGAIPELRRVIVVLGDQIGFEPTLEDSLEAAMEGAPIRIDAEAEVNGELVDDEPDPAPAPAPAPDGEALDRAAEHFARADEALRQGDLATYQRENEQARQAVEAARQEQQGGS